MDALRRLLLGTKPSSDSTLSQKQTQPDNGDCGIKVDWTGERIRLVSLDGTDERSKIHDFSRNIPCSTPQSDQTSAVRFAHCWGSCFSASSSGDILSNFWVLGLWPHQGLFIYDGGELISKRQQTLFLK